MISNGNQTDKSIKKNSDFFHNNLESYNANRQTIDTYHGVRISIDQTIKGIDHLLDIGNGGVFDYNTELVNNITALDLFLDKLPKDLSCPSNAVMKAGSALAIPEKDNTFDGVLLAFLIHHLVGKTVKDCVGNMLLSIKEAHRVLKPGGKLIIAESCIPQWFYIFEWLIFPLASRVINVTIEHPPTLQYTKKYLAESIFNEFANVEVSDIPMGNWVLQFGFKFPTLLTPVKAKLFTAIKK